MMWSEEVVKLYGRQFTIEESFRDQRSLRFGMGLSLTHLGEPRLRERLLLVSALALLRMLGAAGEVLGLDWWLKTNTVNGRTPSLKRQGRCTARRCDGGRRGEPWRSWSASLASQ